MIVQPQCEEKQLSEVIQDISWNDAKIVEWLGYGYQGWQEGHKGYGKLTFFIENTFDKVAIEKCEELDSEIKS